MGADESEKRLENLTPDKSVSTSRTKLSEIGPGPGIRPTFRKDTIYSVHRTCKATASTGWAFLDILA